MCCAGGLASQQNAEVWRAEQDKGQGLLRHEKTGFYFVGIFVYLRYGYLAVHRYNFFNFWDIFLPKERYAYIYFSI